MTNKTIRGHTDYVKQDQTGAILFINRREVKKQKAILRAKKDDRNKVQLLEREVSDLKNLVTQLLENNKHGY